MINIFFSIRETCIKNTINIIWKYVIWVFKNPIWTSFIH